jgi:hypothetical protein
LEEPVATSFSAQSIYDSLQRYGIEVDSEVFIQVVERNNSRERIQARKRSIAEELGLPTNATITQIIIEAEIRKQVDELIARLPHLIEQGLTQPETLSVDGFLILCNPDIKTDNAVHSMRFQLGDHAVAVDLLEQHCKKEIAVEQLSPFQRLGRALGLFRKPEKDEEHNHTLSSPAIKELLIKIEELGVIAHLRFSPYRFGTYKEYGSLTNFLRHLQKGDSLFLSVDIRI